MLSRNHQATNHFFDHNVSTLTGADTAKRLTLSYDMNNYQPLLAHLQASEDPRWILFIAPPGKPNFQFLQQAGINKSRIITLTQKQLNDPQKLFKDALASNNYAAVIHWVTTCDNTFTEQINQLTEKSNTHCFVYCAH